MVATVTPGEFIAKWQASELKERSAAQEHFIDLCRLLGRTDTGRSRPHRRALLLRARGAQGHRRRRLGRRVEATLLRLGIQGPTGGPRRRLQSAAAVRASTREPAAADRFGHGAIPHPHQLDEQRQPDPRVHAGGPCRRRRPRQAQAGDVGPGTAPARREPTSTDRTRRGDVRGTGTVTARTGPQTAARGALRQPAGVLHVRRRRRIAPGQHVQPDARARAQTPRRIHRTVARSIRRNGGRRANRIRGGGVVQRGPVRRRRNAVVRARGDRRRAKGPPRSTGRRSIRRSSARCSSVGSTRTNARSSVRTTPTARRSC